MLHYCNLITQVFQKDIYYINTSQSNHQKAHFIHIVFPIQHVLNLLKPIKHSCCTTRICSQSICIHKNSQLNLKQSLFNMVSVGFALMHTQINLNINMLHVLTFSLDIFPVTFPMTFSHDIASKTEVILITLTFCSRVSTRQNVRKAYRGCVHSVTTGSLKSCYILLDL